MKKRTVKYLLTPMTMATMATVATLTACSTKNEATAIENNTVIETEAGFVVEEDAPVVPDIPVEDKNEPLTKVYGDFVIYDEAQGEKVNIPLEDFVFLEGEYLLTLDVPVYYTGGKMAGYAKAGATISVMDGNVEWLRFKNTEKKDYFTVDFLLVKADELRNATNVEVTTQKVEPIYTEYKDLFLADNFSKLKTEKLEAVNTESLEEVNSKYLLVDSVNLYNCEGIWIGYSKPDVTVTLFRADDKWAEVSFAENVLYVPKENFDLVAMSEADVDSLLTHKEPAQETEKPKADKPATSKPVTVEPVTEPEPAPVVDNTKYTPEEAIAVYRSIMEANGISWNPALKNGGSWGTGWIYLTKGQPEQAGNSSVESFRMGDGDGILWDCYYLEVTGSDENAVYYTKWHP